MYGIKSVSKDGVFYLVNGWKKHGAFWSKTADPAVCGFKTAGLATRSLNRVVEIEPDYMNDWLSLVRFDEQAGTACVLCEIKVTESIW